MPVATTRTAAKAVPVRRATTKTATTKTASSSAAPAPPPTEEELLQILRDPATCEPKTAQHLLSILGATCASLGVCLASQEAPSTRSAAPTSSSRLASASKVSNVTKGRSICASSTSKEEAPIKAATAHSVHFSKRVVNISLTALNELLASGWKSAPPASSKTSSTSARSVGSAAASKSRDLPSAASNQSLHAVKGTPSKTLTDRNVLCLVDCFWIAVHHLWSAPPEVRKGKALEVETVAVTLTKKLVAFELHEVALQHLIELQSRLTAAYTCEADSAAWSSSPSESTSKSWNAVLYPLPHNGAALPPTLEGLILDAQCLALAAALPQIQPRQVPGFAVFLSQRGGPLSWQTHAREVADEAAAADRAAYAAERAISRCLPKLTTTSGQAVLNLRLRSLELLLQVSDLDADAFWDRAARVGTSYYRSCACREEDKGNVLLSRSAFEAVDAMYRRLVELAQNLSTTDDNKTQELKGKGFVHFCENWIQLSKKAGVPQSVDFVAGIMLSSTMSSASEPSDPRQAELAIAHTCASLVRAVVVLDQSSKDGPLDGSLSDALNMAVTALGTLGSWTQHTSVEARIKLFRSLEQLRRRCLAKLDALRAPARPERPSTPGASPNTFAFSSCGPLQALLLAVVDQLEQRIRVPWENAGSAENAAKLPSPADLAADVVQTLRMLSNAMFEVRHPKTHTECSAFLERCISLLMADATDSISISTRAENLHYVSSSFYNLGGRLYSDRRPELAVPFLARACETGARAEELFAAAEEGIRSEVMVQEDVKAKRLDALVHKYEHLAVCYRLTSQIKLAFEAYLQALLNTSHQRYCALATEAGTLSPSSLFLEKSWTSLSSIFKSAVDVATFDLLVPSEESVVPTLLSRKIEPAAVGALLEHWVQVTDTSLHKEGATQALRAMLETGLDIYASNAFPLRRSRILIRLLELELMQTSHKLSHEGIESIGREASNLLERQDLGKDAGLSRFRAQYTAACHIWLMVLAQRRGGAEAARNVLHHATEINVLLRKMLAKATSVPRKVSSASSTLVKAAEKPVRKMVARAKPLKALAASKQQPALPITPPSKKLPLPAAGGSTFEASNVASTSTIQNGECDNFERFYGSIEMAYELLNVFGHTLACIEILKAMRRLTQAGADSANGRESYLKASVALARQYLFLGKVTRAGTVVGQALNAVARPAAAISEDTRVRCLLVSAEYLCHTGFIEKSISRYGEAVELARGLPSASRGPTWQRAMDRCQFLELQALAAETFSAIQIVRGELTSAVAASIQSLRLALRAASSLAKLTEARKKEEAGMGASNHDDPFGPSPEPATSAVAPALSSAQTVQQQNPGSATRLVTSALAGLHWRVSKAVLLAYQRVSRLYAARGTARDAEAFASEGVELATSLAAPLSLSQALVLRSELRLQLGQGENVEADLALGLELLNEEWIPEAVALACIRGDSLRKLNAFGDALASYSAGQSTLLQLNGAFSDMELILPSPRPPQRVSQGSATPSSRRTTATTDPLLPDVQGRLLRRQAWLLQLLARDGDSQIALEQAANLEADEEGRVDDALVHGRIALRRTLQQLQADQVLSLLPESALSMPMATGASSKSLSATGKSTLTVLAAAEAAFRAALASGRARSHVTQVREAYTSLAVVYTLQATLGKAAVKGAAASTANLIDLGSSITLRREYLDAIEHKLHPRASQDDTKWLTFDTGLERSMQKLALTADSEDEDDIQIWSRDSYWRATQRRYLAEHESSELVPAVKLPHDWTVVSISLDMERNTILLSRQGGGREPVVFSLPVDRQCRREGEEEELTIPAALEELKDIVYSCNTAVHGAKDLQGMDARKAWWTERRALDKRLETLLTAIENRWLGAFKSVFSNPPVAAAEDMAALRAQFDKIVKRGCFSTAKRSPRVKLDDAVFECFAGLPSTCTDEDLEDLLHFVMDVYQFNGVPVAIDEVDLDEMGTDLRTALDEYRGKRAKIAAAHDVDHHIFLVLDKDTCPFPWESMPVLRGRSVSRIPSISFLQDRIELARFMRGGQTTRGETSKSESESVRFEMDRSKTFYVLNPSGDLTRSQERFQPWLDERRQLGWRGITGRAPVMDEFSNALAANDLVMYFGHSGAEQYVRPHKIRHLSKCAVTMLWGCSSGILREQGEFDRTGTPYNYMLAGCPALVANLWDTTDRELDNVSESVFTRLGLMGGDLSAQSADSNSNSNSKPVSLVSAVAQARNDCKLPFLTGAACVVYGIPVYWT